MCADWTPRLTGLAYRHNAVAYRMKLLRCSSVEHSHFLQKTGLNQRKPLILGVIREKEKPWSRGHFVIIWKYYHPITIVIGNIRENVLWSYLEMRGGKAARRFHNQRDEFANLKMKNKVWLRDSELQLSNTCRLCRPQRLDMWWTQYLLYKRT